MRVFNEWLSTMRKSINTYSFYCDYKKVYKNVDSVKIELNILNSLIGSSNFDDDFLSLYQQYPNILKAIPVLLAVRLKDNPELYCQDEDGAFYYSFSKPNQTPEQYLLFLRKTGLADLIEKHVLRDLVDYVTGVEVGLDSNARKNRGGHQMEDLVERFITSSEKIRNGKATYYKELCLSDIERKWDIDLSAISNNGSTEKRFDFVIKSEKNIYAIETNFYGSGGSKLNETARSYKTIALESKAIDTFSFVWITDGEGWKSARNNLKETFDVLTDLYNIADLENGVLNDIIK